MSQIKPDLAEARRLFELGFKIVQLHPNTKIPVGDGWQKKPIKFFNSRATGYGLPLEMNGLCSLDPDHHPLAVKGMSALGFVLEEFLNTGARTKSTRPNSGGRSTFQSEGDLRWIKFSCKTAGTILELRANSANLQDAIVGLTYLSKDEKFLYTQEYANGIKVDEAPPLPDSLWKWWEKMSTDLDFLHDQQEKFIQAVGGDVIKANSLTAKGKTILAHASPHRGVFNRTHKVDDFLNRHGYTYHRDKKRWSHPNATGSAGISPIPYKDDLWMSNHAGDPLSGCFDAWTCFVVLEHGGDLVLAEKAIKPLNSEDVPAPPVKNILDLLYKFETSDEMVKKLEDASKTPWDVKTVDFSVSCASD